MMFSDGKHEIEELLLQIEAQRRNRAESSVCINARCFMVFLLVGGDDGSRQMIEAKLTALYGREGTAEVICLNEAALLHRKLQNLITRSNLNGSHYAFADQIMLCPVFFSLGAEPCLKDSFIRAFRETAEYLALESYSSIWQPFLIFDTDSRSFPGLYRDLSAISTFYREMETAGRRVILHRCGALNLICGGDSVVESIAVCAVMENIIPESSYVSLLPEERLSLEPGDAEEGRLFFSLGSMVISNPDRSMIYERMLGAIDFFSGEKDEKSRDRLNHMDFGFIRELTEDCIRSELPMEGGQVSVFPLFGVMEGTDLEQRISQMIRSVYRAPVYTDRVKHLLFKKVRKQFYEEYFGANGSLKEFRECLQNGRIREILDQYRETVKPEITVEQLPKKGKLAKIYKNNAYPEARAQICKWIEELGQQQLELLEKDLESPETLKIIKKTEDGIRMIRQSVLDRRLQLGDKETDLGVYSNITFSDAGTYNRQFDMMVCRMLLEEKTDLKELVTICFEAVKNMGDTNQGYLKRLDEICRDDVSGERTARLVDFVQQGMRFSFPVNTGSQESVYMLGDTGSKFLDRLQMVLNTSLMEAEGLDRICILHLSGPIDQTRLPGWRYLERYSRQD